MNELPRYSGKDILIGWGIGIVILFTVLAIFWVIVKATGWLG